MDDAYDFVKVIGGILVYHPLFGTMVEVISYRVRQNQSLYSYNDGMSECYPDRNRAYPQKIQYSIPPLLLLTGLGRVRDVDTSDYAQRTQ